ncbi:MAG: hypothetical protein AAB794_03620 [Patescibacteria group bacterium]
MLVSQVYYDTTEFILFGAGIPYGIVTGICFIYVLPLTRKYLRLLAWIVASGVSYYVGTSIYLLSSRILSDGSDAGSYALAGFCGALILTVIFHFIFHKMSLSKHAVVIVTGGIIPFILAVTFYRDTWHIFASILYIVWQTVITTLLGSSLLSKEQKSV